MARPLPLVLLSNDDGIEADGLGALLAALEGLAEARVIAPDRPRSGVGHALTDEGALHVKAAARGLAVDGTPADCARLGLASGTALFADPRDAGLAERFAEARRERSLWLVSGINHGANLGVDVFVSGTAAAAREAAILGFPALAISQYVARHRKPDWRRALLRARPVLAALLARPPAPGAYWNVNLPHPHDEATDCEIVHCAPDPSPHAVRYERTGERYAYTGDFHARPRRPDHDVDVCFGGRVAVSEIHLHGGRS